MNNKIYPIVLKPLILEKPWGEKGKGPDLVPGTDSNLKIGEIWLTADGNQQSTVQNGPLTGMSLRDLRIKWGADLLGKKLGDLKDQPFPLLLKFIHANEYLSVQVHPDDQNALKLEGSGPGKTEAWYILEADSRARLILGLEPGVDRAGLSEALKQGEVEKVLYQLQPRVSEAYYVQAGLLHAIGPGITLFEIQQNVDLTYRFYDWGRVDDQGRPRELHLDKAMRALEVGAEHAEPFSGLSYEKDGVSVTALVAGLYFALERWELKKQWQGQMDPARFDILTVIAGQGQLDSSETDRPISLTPGTTVLLPAALEEYRIIAPQNLVLLRSFVPDLEADIFMPLKDFGFSSTEIQKLGGWRKPNDLSVFS
ncbi:MAG: mannose-6-phosphate isomerase [Deltaproteobacteria bacterium]|nr:mannose-6-phosphate isomerase [Deltaproteobacteria bacterium]MBW2053721.1 mannose-6-phosphate isomerase [Deltaproteobacteria bacterium]MBW2142297.1 mannose-6-phosphate isomerase [Deltaproteobacteria bacterium]MBW2324318.1 mannose-6-phosphate isomerase [Deltaproteobacteria bacterium]